MQYKKLTSIFVYMYLYRKIYFFVVECPYDILHFCIVRRADREDKFQINTFNKIKLKLEVDKNKKKN